MKSICVSFLDPVQFFRFIEGRFHGNQFCVVSHRNAMEHWNADGALTVSMTRLHLVQMWWVSDQLQYTQSSRESTVYNRRQSALRLVYLRLLGGSTVMFCYYLLGGDTVVPSGLYARLCHAFLVFSYCAMLLYIVCLSVSCRYGQGQTDILR